MKEIRHTSVPTLWLHLHKVQKQAKVIGGNKSEYMLTLVGSDSDGQQDTFWETGNVHFDLGCGYIGIYLKIHQAALLEFLCFTVCTFSGENM